MAKIIGIGGIFFKASDPEMLQKWYSQNLGMADGTMIFGWQMLESPNAQQQTIWSPFAQDTTYFEPSRASFMINYIVDDLDGMLAQLRANGVQVDEKTESMEYGRFGWAMDPDGNRFELWEPSQPKA